MPKIFGRHFLLVQLHDGAVSKTAHTTPVTATPSIKKEKETNRRMCVFFKGELKASAAAWRDTPAVATASAEKPTASDENDDYGEEESDSPTRARRADMRVECRRGRSSGDPPWFV